MSQNNGGLNWDQVQLPNFGGSSNALAAAAQLLDGALGKVVDINKGVLDNRIKAREDGAEKALLQNIYKHRTGREAQDALAAGSLYDGIDLDNLNVAAMRKLQDDIKSIYDMEGKDISNTQGYLDHDLTRANTSNVYDQISNRRQKLAMEQQAARDKQLQEQQLNAYLNKLDDLDPYNPEYHNEVLALKKEFNVDPLWDSTSKHQKNRSSVYDDTLGMLTKDQDSQKLRNEKAVNDDLIDAEANARTTTERELLVAEKFNQMTPAQKAIFMANHGENYPSLAPLDDSGLGLKFNQEDLLGKSQLVGRDPNQSIMVRGNEPIEQQPMTPKEIAKQIIEPSVDYVKESSKHNIQIDPNAKKMLDPYFEDNLNATIDDYIGKEHWLDEYAIPDETQMKIANVASTYEGQQFGNVFMENSPFSGAPRPKTDAKNKLPFTGTEIQDLIVATKGAILNEPVTQENLNKWATLLHRRSTASGTKKGNEREFRNKQKEDKFNKQLEEAKKIHENKYRQEGMRQGLTGKVLDRYIDNASRAAAYNDIRSKEEYQNLLNTRPTDEVYKERASRKLESIKESPDRAVTNIISESEEMATRSINAAIGAGYLDPSTFQDVPNNTMSVAKEITKLNPDIDETDSIKEVKRTMNEFNISSIEAGKLLVAVGGKFDKSAMSAIRESNKKIESIYKVKEVTALNKDIQSKGDKLRELGNRRSQILNRNNVRADKATKEKVLAQLDIQIFELLLKLEKDQSKLRNIYEGFTLQE